MSLRRFVASLGLCVTFVAAAGLVAAAPKSAKKAPAKAGSGSGSGSAAAGGASGAGSGSGSGAGGGSGSAVQPIEDAPPSDMNGVDENPDAPKAVGVEEPVAPKAPVAKKPVGYPIEEVLRPITLPENMSEISIAPHAEVSPFSLTDAIHARYGITNQVQIGLTYAYIGVYNQKNVDSTLPNKYSAHSGKAFGFDVTVLLQNWLAVRVGIPFYVSPLAYSLQLAAPIKFTFGDKFAIGGLDDLLNIKLHTFAPRYDQELFNAQAAQNNSTNTEQSNGHLRISGYVEYQHAKNLAFIGRLGVDSDLGESGGGGGAGTTSGGGTVTFIRAAFQYSPRNNVDLGASLGWDDLSTLGSFGPSGFLALRI